MNNEKNYEKSNIIRLRLDAVEDKWNKKRKDVNNKHKKAEQAKRDLDQSIMEYKTAKKEENQARMQEHNQKLEKIKRGQSAYKVHLVQKMIEKGQRCEGINQKREIKSQMAYRSCKDVRGMQNQTLQHYSRLDQN